MGDTLPRTKEGAIVSDEAAPPKPLAGMKLFAGTANPELAKKVSENLGIRLGKRMLTRFADGEIRTMIEESARGMDIFILQPTCAPANETYMELAILLDAFRRASARRITVVVPYFGYARQDKKIKPREPITARLMADFLQLAGANRVVAVDLHADQIQGFFSVPVDHLYGGPILANYFISKGFRDADDVVVVSPDSGGVTRANALADRLACSFVVIAKRRPAPNTVEVVEIVGDFVGKRCVMIDDMIDTGGSIVAGAQALMDRGAREVIVCCTHAIFSKDAPQSLQESCISQVVVLDTIPVDDKSFPKLKVLSCAPLIADAIRRIHHNESVSELFENWR